MLNYNVHSYIIPAAISVEHGIYIQDVNGRLWKTKTWDNSVKPNAIAVIAKEDKFLISLTKPSSDMPISRGFNGPLENCTAAISSAIAAKVDYNGAGNTAKILKAQPNTGYAAGYCDSFIFPDGKTKGYLPSLGQLHIACLNKKAVNAALGACGGTVMREDFYWSSTLWGVSCDGYHYCWELHWRDSNVYYHNLTENVSVRPFADF